MADIIKQNFENSTPFLRGYKELKIPIADSDGLPEWPELFPIEKIDEMRETVGLRHFSSQMMLEYISEDKARLEPGALVFYDGEFDHRTATIKFSDFRVQSSDYYSENRTLTTENLITGVAMYWDPSGGRVKSDSSVCVLIYRDDKNRRAFIHDVRYLRVADEDMHPLATQCEGVLDFMRAHNQKRIAIEVNGLGNALPEILREVALKRGQSVIVQKIINHQRKETRILDAIEPLLTTGRLFAHVRIKSTLLLSEMLGWSPLAVGGTDDGLDALAGALRLTPAPVRPLGAMTRIIKANTSFKL